MPDAETIRGYIYRWEQSKIRTLSERYVLYYCRAFAIKPTQFGPQPEAASDVEVIQPAAVIPAEPGVPHCQHVAYRGIEAPESSFFSLPNLPELLLTGRERPFWTYFARRQMWDPSALTDSDIEEMVRSVEQPGGTRAILEMYRARQVDAEQNRPHYANPISCPVLAVGAQAYLGDQVSRQLVQVASDVQGAVIPESGHNIALENPAALAQAYLDFFSGH